MTVNTGAGFAPAKGARKGAARWWPSGLTLLLILSAAVMLLAALASPGLFLIDEAIYNSGAEALHRTGSIVVSNGYETFGSRDLRASYLVPGPLGLVPQYPVGTALAGAPLMALFGAKALVALNVIGAIGTLFVTHALARRLFGSRRVADLAVVLLALCSFWSEYAVGQWPHSIALFFTVSAVWLFVIALDRDAGAWRLAILSGTAVGLGMFFRLETVILLPAVVALAILMARRPAAILAGGIAGLVPVLAAMGYSNALRFGTWNPLSYGTTGGGTDASNYIALGGILLLGLGALVVLRLAVMPPRRWLIAAGLAGAAGVLALAASPYGGGLTRAALGAYALLVDAVHIPDRRPVIQPQPDGSVLFWGLPKKALGQSLPWLGGLMLTLGLRDAQARRGAVIVLTVAAVWALPFSMRAWYGGFGSNMRYFIPVLPLVATLAACLIADLWTRLGSRRPMLMTAGLLIAAVLAMLWLTVWPQHIAVLHQRVATTLLAAVAALSLLAALWPRPPALAGAFAAICAGLGLSAVLGLLDLGASQLRRGLMAEYSARAAAIPGHALFYAPPDAVAGVWADPDQLVALPRQDDGSFDTGFIDAACAAGYRVFLFPMFVPMIAAQGYDAVPPEGRAPGFSELTCRRPPG